MEDDSVTLPGWLGIPGIRHSIRLARWRHFFITFCYCGQHRRHGHLGIYNRVRASVVLHN